MICSAMKIPLAVLFCGFLAASFLRSAVFEWEDKPRGDHVVALRLFVPDDVDKVRAIVVLTPGLDGDGRGMAGDSAWQAFAQKNQTALLACNFKGKDGGSYYKAEKWCGKAFLDGIKDLAKLSSHPEIANAPLAFWGHSAGGQFNYNFACWKPERTVAFIANKGGYYETDSKPMVRKVPGLWFCGDKDTAIRIKNITERYEDNRKRGALWALVMEPGVGHGIGRSKELGMVFLEEAINARLDSSGKLQAIDPRSGWLGDPEKKTVEKNASSNAGSKDTCWFPGEATAVLWQEIVSGPAASAPAPAESEPADGA